MTRREMFQKVLLQLHEGKPSKTMILLLDYIDMLSAELDETAAWADIHGWKSSRGEEGKRIRAALGFPDSDDKGENKT